MNTIIYTASCGHSSEYHGTGRVQVSDALRCAACHQIVTVVALSASLAGQRQGRMKTFPEHVHDCLDNTAAAVRSWCKPHLRLHYVPDARNPSAKKYPWYVERLGGPVKHGACITTMLMRTSADAVNAARVIWWGLY